MQSHNVPTIPGYQGDDQSESTIKAKAIEIGFPVLLKASAGGGGKGMRIVRQESELDKAINEAKSEALNGFGDDTF
jgi:acetyl/propionyl-CoA carboxylase alpha subunit